MSRKTLLKIQLGEILLKGAQIVPDIERMASAMVLIPELHTLMMKIFFDQTWSATLSKYGPQIAAAKCEGTMPQVEIIVHEKEVMN